MVEAMELGRYGVRANCIAPIARTRLTLQTPGLGDNVAAPEDAAVFDALDPATIPPPVAYLAPADSPFTGRGCPGGRAGQVIADQNPERQGAVNRRPVGRPGRSCRTGAGAHDGVDECIGSQLVDRATVTRAGRAAGCAIEHLIDCNGVGRPQHDCARPVAEQNACSAVVPVEYPGEYFGAHHQAALVLARAGDLVRGGTRVDEPAAPPLAARGPPSGHARPPPAPCQSVVAAGSTRRRCGDGLERLRPTA